MKVKHLHLKRMGKSSGNGENFGNWFDFYLTQGRAREDAVPLPPLAVFPRVFQGLEEGNRQ